MKDLSCAMATSDCLVDYKLSGSTSTGKKQNQDRSKKHKAVRKPSDQIEGKKSGMATIPKAKDVTTTRNVQQTSKPIGCFICQVPHRAKDCPIRKKLSALQNTKDVDLDSDDPSPQLIPLQVVTTLYTSTSFFYQLMYVFVHLNRIGVKEMVDMGVTHSCLTRSMAARI